MEITKSKEGVKIRLPPYKINIKKTKGVEKINHQYSKSYEFEKDFEFYSNKYLKAPVKYFSFLRPLNELQIAMLFSKHEKYHSTFKSCNVGSKSKEWKWCCDCPKCLFVYTILSHFLYKDKLIHIFGTDMFENKNLLNTFIELTGYGETKPFECVGTKEEINLSLDIMVDKYKTMNVELPKLLEGYTYDKAALKSKINKMIANWNNKNNLPYKFEEKLKKYII